MLPILLAATVLGLVYDSVAAQDKVSKSGAVSTRSADGQQLSALSPATRISLNAAVEALEKGVLPDAEHAARAAVAASPRSPVTHNVLGVVLDRLGRHDDAVSEFRIAVKLDPNFVSARNNIARSLAERGKRVEAIAEFEQILKLEPTHVQAHYNLGALYGEGGEYEKSAEHFSRALELAPNDLQLALAFLNAAYRSNRTTEADAVADKVENAVGSDSRSLFTLATVLAQTKQYERAARLFLRVNDLTPHTYEVLYNLGIALYNLNRNDEATRYLAEAADLNPAPAETHFRLGLIASEQSDHANAVEEFRHAIERQPKDPNLHYLLGREYFRAGYWEGAINEFSRAIEADPKQAVYYLSRADSNYRRGEAAAAATDFDRAAQLNPDIEDIEYWQGYTYRVAGNFDVAREHLEHFVASHPNHFDALASLGFISLEQGFLDQAESWLKRALSIDAKNGIVLYDYARVAMKRRDYQEAVKRLEQVIALNPASTQAQYQLFLAYSRVRQPDKAQIALAAFKRLDALEKQTNQERIMDDKLRTQQMLGQSPQ